MSYRSILEPNLDAL
jgi:MFS family permease